MPEQTIKITLQVQPEGAIKAVLLAKRFAREGVPEHIRPKKPRDCVIYVVSGETFAVWGTDSHVHVRQGE